MSTKATAPKKVRLACRRCRVRRIKCDGQVPACSNCAKAGEVCIDVDSQNADLLIPRNFTTAARARIKWLEDIIKERLPDVDLTLGPQVDMPSEHATSSMTAVAEDNVPDQYGETTTGRQVGSFAQHEGPQSRKRTADENEAVDNEESFPEGARSVAFNLGMLSLNSDSSQKHYLGSSSGVLFTNIIGASPSSDASGSTTARNSVAPLQDHYQMLVSQKNLQSHYWSLHQSLRQELPKHEDALLLLHTYLREIHPNYPVLEPLSLFSALEALYECLSCPLDNDPLTHGWPRALTNFYWNGQVIRPNSPTSADVPMPVVAFIFFMIFNVAAVVKVRARVYEYSPEKLYRAALLFSGDSFSRTSLSSIQALVMLMIHSLLIPAEINLWTIIHVAMAHCVELGLHREPSVVANDEMTFQQVKRFTFYVIYSLDRSVSTIQGRPLGLRDEAFDVRMPLYDVTDHRTHNHSFVSPTFLTDVTIYSTQQFHLDRIVSDIKTHLYHLPVESLQFPWPQDPTNHQERICKVLQAWWEETSQKLSALQGLDNYHRQLWTLRMKIRYYTTMVLLFQPSQAARNPSESALQKCFNSACAILQSYQLLQDWHCLQYSWRAVQNIFAAGATIVYAFWSSKAVQRNSSIIELSKTLRSCSSLLSVGGEWWPSVRSGKTSFETVVDLTIRKMYQRSTSSKQPRLVTHQHRNLNVQGLDKVVNSQMFNNTTQAFSQDTLNFDILDQQTVQLRNDGNEVVSDLPAFQGTHSNYSNPSPEAQSTLGILPEIEDFLADFDNSDFSWNMPLHGFDEHTEIGPSFFFGGQ